jgi:hypothetical protein
VVSANRDCPKIPDGIDGFDGIRTVSHDVAATENGIVSSELRAPDACV